MNMKSWRSGFQLSIEAQPMPLPPTNQQKAEKTEKINSSPWICETEDKGKLPLRGWTDRQTGAGNPGFPERTLTGDESRNLE